MKILSYQKNPPEEKNSQRKQDLKNIMEEGGQIYKDELCLSEQGLCGGGDSIEDIVSSLDVVNYNCEN
ncbi:hypothetical protein [Mycoavidus sp. B2-EB]|uniref:hypothetical protein n=1 Tax=Mycoavidus sp. B2-EB TaxID=2651972 RepID=UPI001E2CD6CB|nr:hypothetical protein [Mycoavidus sp. B2-EB]BBO59242.1 hypothetical protein MPB2EB_0353 [Mycoavidus sp. B2-EB]